MKKSELKKIIKEEIQKVLKEANSVDTLNFSNFKILFNKMKKDFEDEVAQEAFLDELDNLAKKAGVKRFNSTTDAEGLIGDIQDGMSLADAIKDFKDLLAQSNTKKSNTLMVKIDNPGADEVVITMFSKTEVYIAVGETTTTFQSKSPITSIEVANQLVDKGVAKKLGNKYVLNSKYKNYKAKQFANLLK